MIKKNVIKRRKKTVKTTNIMLLIFIATLCLSVGYSYFSTQLNISGNVKLSNEEEENPDIPTEKSNSKLTVKLGTSWGSNDLYCYNLNLVLKNLDDDVNGWLITIDVPPYVNVEESSFWCAAEVTVTEYATFHRISFSNYSWNANVNQEGELVFGFNIAFTQEIDITNGLKNVIFNGKLIEDIEYENS